MVIMFFTAFVTHKLCALYAGNLWTTIFVRLAICVIIPNLLMFIFYHRMEEAGFVISKAKKFLGRRGDNNG